ncbi:S1 family peptidase [Hymenobacter arizonensis]|uniref:Serine protease, S1-C subfamily, contains C-terminal PDZ domain n=1 Tax=Hymenobacter arizonensis TaxID=1227077 RepID=A0A1I5XPU8_HYMAR|nr:serine protease [Hymenobacter arizonensis]SFQ33991.1 serine protease, S1-C subfamily, contains C-terminal PDZ domain [Hymenobacter arizonensis]
MMTEADYYALFEAYAHGELAGPARANFEARLAADPALALRYADFTELTGTLRAYGQRQNTRQKLQGLHAAMLAAETPEEQSTEAAAEKSPLTHTVNPMLRISRTERVLREFWNGHRATMGVAASVAVLAVFATLLGLEWWRAAKTQPSMYGYTVLKREVERIKKSQKDLTLTLNQFGRPGTTPPTAKESSGTGFALTSEGYLVTSYHVIQGADSVLVEGNDRKRYHAEPVYSDVKHDLAILRITDKRFTGFGRLPYAIKAGQADLGERVYTLGYPREDVVYGEGALSARSGFQGDTAFYQVSIPVNPGNSGGPLLDERGNLIGVVSGRQNDAQSAAFATKSSYLVRLVDSLAATKPAVPYHLPRYGQLAGSARPQQLKKLKDYVFVVKVFE